MRYINLHLLTYFQSITCTATDNLTRTTEIEHTNNKQTA